MTVVKEGYPKTSKWLIKHRGGICEDCFNLGKEQNPLVVYVIDETSKGDDTENLIVLCTECKLKRLDRLRIKDRQRRKNSQLQLWC